MGIVTGIKNIINRNRLYESEERAKEDLLKQNKNKLEDVSQRRGLVINSGLTTAERDYILSDSMIASAIQLYQADVLSICDSNNVLIQSDAETVDDEGKIAEKIAKVQYVFKQIYSDQLTEAMIINLLNNGEIFLETNYSKTTNEISVVESSHSRCTQLCYSNGKVAAYVVSDIPVAGGANGYSYTLNMAATGKSEVVEPDKMVRVYIPTLINSKVCIELDVNDDDEALKELIGDNNNLFYTGSQSLLKQVYPDWLNSKLLELAVYRDRIAKSRFIHLIALELGRTSRVTSDEIYDNVKDYFDKRAVVDLEQQTFKSVVGDEPFTDYKVYTTRNGVGQLTFDNSLSNADANVSSLADLEYNQTKVFAGLGIPKQYLNADDNGSALSNGGSLFFMDEKYQKRVLSYVKRIAEGYKNSIKNILIQQEGKDFFYHWDFSVQFPAPESNEEVYRVKTTKMDYVNSMLELIDKINENPNKYSIDTISGFLGDDVSAFMAKDDENDTTDGK